jgi:hypothetical protein
MKIRYCIAALVFALVALPARAETLTNEQIVRMAAAGLGDQVLIAKIKASDNSFDTSTDGLLALRKKGVSNPVIAAMIAVDGAGPKAVAAPALTGSGVSGAALSQDSPDPSVPHPLGIYLLADWRSPTRMVPIEPVTSDRTRSGSIIAYVLTGGLAKRSQKAVIPEAAARIETPRRRPIFYFFFSDGRSDQARGGFWNPGSAISPGDFNLVRFDVDEDTRTAKIGSSNIMGSSRGVPWKDRIPFAFSQVSPGVYSVQPEQELENGEYGFIYSQPAGGGGGPARGDPQGARIFDFSVDDGTGDKGDKE